MNQEELEAKRREEEEARKAGGGDPAVTKSEMKSEMRSMIQELLEMGMIGSRVANVVPELRLELMPNDVKLEGSKNYLSWSRRVRVLLGGKGIEHYLEECVEPANKLSPEWRVSYNKLCYSGLVIGIHVTVC